MKSVTLIPLFAALMTLACAHSPKEVVNPQLTFVSSAPTPLRSSASEDLEMVGRRALPDFGKRDYWFNHYAGPGRVVKVSGKIFNMSDDNFNAEKVMPPSPGVLYFAYHYGNGEFQVADTGVKAFAGLVRETAGALGTGRCLHMTVDQSKNGWLFSVIATDPRGSKTLDFYSVVSERFSEDSKKMYEICAKLDSDAQDSVQISNIRELFPTAFNFLRFNLKEE